MLLLPRLLMGSPPVHSELRLPQEIVSALLPGNQGGGIQVIPPRPSSGFPLPYLEEVSTVPPARRLRALEHAAITVANRAIQSCNFLHDSTTSLSSTTNKARIRSSPASTLRATTSLLAASRVYVGRLAHNGLVLDCEHPTPGASCSTAGYYPYCASSARQLSASALSLPAQAGTGFAQDSPPGVGCPLFCSFALPLPSFIFCIFPVLPLRFRRVPRRVLGRAASPCRSQLD